MQILAAKIAANQVAATANFKGQKSRLKDMLPLCLAEMDEPTETHYELEETATSQPASSRQWTYTNLSQGFRLIG